MSYEQQRLDDIEQEIARFSATLKELREAYKKGSYARYSVPRESGAATRASMDLTRALARFRRR